MLKPFEIICRKFVVSKFVEITSEEVLKIYYKDVMRENTLLYKRHHNFLSNACRF